MEIHCQSLDGEVGQNPFLYSTGVANYDEREQLPVGMERLAWEINGRVLKKLKKGKGVWFGMKRAVGGVKIGIEMTIH